MDYLDDFRFAVRRSSIILDSACTLPEKTRDDSESGGKWWVWTGNDTLVHDISAFGHGENEDFGAFSGC